MHRRKNPPILPPDAPRLWTGELMLDRLLEVAGLTSEDLKLAFDRVREALDAQVKGEPDHSIRLRAAEDLFSWLGFRASRKPVEPDDSAGRAINITIVTGDDAARPLEAHGRAVRVISGDGEGPANGGALP